MSEWAKKNITRESTETFLASKGLSVAQFEIEGICFNVKFWYILSLYDKTFPNFGHWYIYNPFDVDRMIAPICPGYEICKVQDCITLHHRVYHYDKTKTNFTVCDGDKCKKHYHKCLHRGCDEDQTRTISGLGEAFGSDKCISVNSYYPQYSHWGAIADYFRHLSETEGYSYITNLQVEDKEIDINRVVGCREVLATGLRLKSLPSKRGK